MKITKTAIPLCLLASFFLAGCVDDGPATPKKETAAVPESPKTPAKKAKIGKNVYLEIQDKQRRVLVEAYVCLRKGALEQFLTRTRTKEHEAILAADVDARDIHTALLAAGAEAGKPVQFQPKYKPATGSMIKIRVTFEVAGRRFEVPASKWIRDVKSMKEMNQNWVFGGSQLYPDPMDATKKPYYAANDGDIICVSNFDTAMLDLPIESSKDDSDRAFEAYTERIPPLETPVLVILEPVAKKPAATK
jgi:hypothetical protein